MMKGSFLASAILVVFWATIASAAFITSGEIDPADPSTWTNATDGYIGKTVAGELTVNGDSDLLSNAGFLGYDSGSMGTVTVEGGGSTWTNSDNLYVGSDGSGLLNIFNGGSTNDIFGYIGRNQDSSGTVRVNGTNSKWTHSGPLYVGYDGAGTLEIVNGGNVNCVYSGIGENHGAIGIATVEGAGSNWISSSTLAVGEGGSGTLNIMNGGNVSSSNGYLGRNILLRGVGMVAVDGAGSKWTNSGDLYVGEYGKGILSITNGGSVSNTFGCIGYYYDSTGTVKVDGVGSTWTISGDLYLGGAGTACVTQTGGTVSVGGTLSLRGGGPSYASDGKSTYNLNGGTLILKALTKGMVDGTAAFNLGGGTLQAKNAFTSSFPITLTGIGGDANVNTNGFTVTLSGILSGAAGLNKLGNESLTLSGANTYTGYTRIRGGSIILGNASALSNSTLDYSNYGGTMSFGTLTGAVLGGLQGSQNLALTNKYTSAVALQVGKNGQSTEYSGSLSGSGSLTKIGSGTLTLSGANTFTGTTTLKEGTLVLDYSSGGANKLSDANILQIVGTAALQIKGDAYTEVLGGVALVNGTLELSRPWGGTATLRMNNMGSSQGATMNLAAAGIADIDTLNTNNILAPSGRACVTVGGNDWAVNSTNAHDGLVTAYTAYQTGGQDSWATTDNVFLTGNAALTTSRIINTLKVDTSESGQALDIGSGQTLLLYAGGLLFVGDHDYSISDGTITCVTSANSDLIVQTYGAGTLTIDSVITNLGSCFLTKTGPGTLILTRANTFSGAVNFNGGWIQATSVDQLGSSSAMNFNGGGLLFADVFDPSVRTMNFFSGGTTLNTQEHDITLANAIGNGGDGDLTKLGSGTLTLSGANTFKGAVHFNEGFIFATALNRLGNGDRLDFNGGGLQFGGVFDPSVRIMDFLSGGALLDTQANIIKLANPVGNDGPGGLTKKGSGTLTLEAMNTYSGATIVDGGTLEIAGGISANGTSLIDVKSGKAVLSTTDIDKGDLDIVTAVGATFEVASGTHLVGEISGGGMTKVDSGASLTAAAITQGTLTIGGARGSDAAAAVVPEPSVLVLIGGVLVMLAVGGGVKGRKRKEGEEKVRQ